MGGALARTLVRIAAAVAAAGATVAGGGVVAARRRPSSSSSSQGSSHRRSSRARRQCRWSSWPHAVARGTWLCIAPGQGRNLSVAAFSPDLASPPGQPATRTSAHPLPTPLCPICSALLPPCHPTLDGPGHTACVLAAFQGSVPQPTRRPPCFAGSLPFLASSPSSQAGPPLAPCQHAAPCPHPQPLCPFFFYCHPLLPSSALSHHVHPASCQHTLQQRPPINWALPGSDFRPHLSLPARSLGTARL